MQRLQFRNFRLHPQFYPGHPPYITEKPFKQLSRSREKLILNLRNLSPPFFLQKNHIPAGAVSDTLFRCQKPSPFSISRYPAFCIEDALQENQYFPSPVMLPVPGQPSVSYINFPVSLFFRRPFFIVIFPVIGCDQPRQSTPSPYLLRFNCFLQRKEIIKDHNHIAFIIPVFSISLLYLRFSLSYYPGFSNGRSPFVIS